MKKLLFPALLATAAFAQQTATVTIKTDNVINKVHETEFHGVNLVGLWNGPGPEDNGQPEDNGIDAQNLQAYKQLGMGHLRFPGGVPCQWYDWETPLKTGWTYMTPQNTAAFGKAGGSRMLFQTNTASDHLSRKNKKTGEQQQFSSSGEHAANWVKAMKEQGIEVAFWEIGNEPEMDAPGHAKGSQEAIYAWYNKKFEEQAKAIKAVDPKAKIMGPSATNTWFWWAQKNLEKFMKAHGDKEGTGLVDVVSVHWYPEDIGQSLNWEKSRGTAQREWPKRMNYIKGVLEQYDSRPLELFITEWNWGAGDKNDIGQMHANALGVADILGMFLRTGVAGHSFFCLNKIQRNWGFVALKQDGRPWHEVSPTYYGLVLAGFLGGEVLETKNTADEADMMAAYASRNAEGVTTVMLINKTGEPIKTTLDWDGAKKPAGAGAKLYTLTADSPSSRDVTFNNVAKPTPWLSDLPPPAAAESHTALNLAPYSITVLRVK